MTASELRLWCMQMPRPSSVKVTCNDGAQHELACGAQANVGWKKLAETLVALDWQLIEALDEKGALIRATRPELGDDDEDGSPSLPIVAVPQGTDAETQRFVLMAQLIANAYKHSTDTAFQRLSDMIEAASERAAEADRTRETFYRAQIRQLESQIRAMGKEPDAGGDGGGMINAMLAQFMSGAASRGAAPTNGTHSDGE